MGRLHGRSPPLFPVDVGLRAPDGQLTDQERFFAGGLWLQHQECATQDCQLDCDGTCRQLGLT
jgi:hypothetical protein